MNGSMLAAGGYAAPLISQLIAFGVLAFLFWKFGLPFFAKLLGDRTKSVEDQFAKLEQETQKTAQAVAELKQKLASVDAESKRRIEAAVAEGTRLRDQALADARAQAEGELARVKRDIQIERDKALLELRAEVVRLTVLATEGALDAVITPQVHEKMVDKYLGGLEQAAKKS